MPHKRPIRAANLVSKGIAIMSFVASERPFTHFGSLDAKQGAGERSDIKSSEATVLSNYTMLNSRWHIMNYLGIGRPCIARHHASPISARIGKDARSGGGGAWQPSLGFNPFMCP